MLVVDVAICHTPEDIKQLVVQLSSCPSLKIACSQHYQSPCIHVPVTLAAHSSKKVRMQTMAVCPLKIFNYTLPQCVVPNADEKEKMYCAVSMGDRERRRSIKGNLHKVQHKASMGMLTYNRPQSRRFSWIMISLTAAMTNRICVVSVAQVKWV